MQRFYPVWILSFALLMCSCATEPVEMINKTNKAMENAKSVHAELFASDDWKAAERASAQARTLLDQKKWGEANTALLRAMNRYNKAHELAEGSREAFIKEVRNQQKTIEIRFKELREKVAANAGKLSAANKKAMDAACKEIEQNVVKIGSLLESGQFNDAKFLAGTTLRNIWEHGQELPGAKSAK
jgi:hypothetical protein